MLQDVGQLERLGADWAKLRRELPGPAGQPAWVRAAVGAVPEPERPCVVTVGEGGTVTALAPLAWRGGPRGGLRMLTPHDASGFLYRDEGALQRLVEAVLGLRLPLHCNALPAGAPTDLLLGARARGWVARRSVRSMGPSVVLDRENPDPLDRLNSRRRNEIRRRRKKAAATGSVRFAMVAPGADLGSWFDAYVRLEAAGWKGRAGTALSLDASQRTMLRTYLSDPAVRDDVRVATMHVDGQLAAIDLTVVADRRLWGLKAAYDEGLAHLAPGMLLKIHQLEWAARTGLERLELMGDTDDWKAAWGAGPELVSLKLLPPTPRGGLQLAAATARAQWRGFMARRSGSG